MPSIRLNVRFDVSRYGPLNPFNEGKVDSDTRSLTSIHNDIVKCLFGINSSCIQKRLQVSTQLNIWRIQICRAWTWVVFYQSVGHHRSYWKHLAQRGWNEPEHALTCTTFALRLQAVRVPVASEYSYRVRGNVDGYCKPLGQHSYFHSNAQLSCCL